MELDEGKQALLEIQELERQLDARLENARQKAKWIVEEASAQTEAIIKEKRDRLENIRCTLNGAGSPQADHAAESGVRAFHPNNTVTQKLAQELFGLISQP